MLGRWEWAEYIAEGFVVLGCLGELVADTGEKWLGERRSKHLERWSTVVLILALLVSLTALWRTNELTGYVIGSLGDKADRADSKARDASDVAGRAKDKAGEAKTKADAVGVEADQAQTKIAGVDRHADVLAYFLSARRVQDESGLENDLRKEFRGEHITFDSYVGDEEAYWLCSQLAEIARKAGVDSKDECAAKQLSNRLPITDLHISAPTIDEGQRLLMVLKKLKRVPGYSVGLHVAPEVTVTVGVKPSIPLFPMVKRTASKTIAKP